jgi:N-methylhydantoinase A
VLGYINPSAIAGGGVKLHPVLAEAAVERVAAPLDISTIAAAWGIYAVAAANMTRAVKAVSTYRGRDPRDFALIAFGGNGPMVAIEIARTLGMRQVIVPPAPGVFSAFGLLCADTEYVASRTLFRRLADLCLHELEEVLSALKADVQADLARDAIAAEASELQCGLELRYSGQAYELGVPFVSGTNLEAVATAFHTEHERTYGHSSPGAPVDLVSVKVLGRSPAHVSTDALSSLAGGDGPAGANQVRAAYFGPQMRAQQTPIVARASLRGSLRRGPMIVEEYDATSVVPPDCTAWIDGAGNLFIRIEEGT